MKRIMVGFVAASIVVFGIASLFFVGYTQSLPAPTVDRVGFPAGYKDSYKLLYVFDNYQNRQIRKVYGNDVAASVSPGQVFNFPYGSIILFESYTVRQDSSGEPILDENGRFIPVDLTTVFVMRKEKGFGEDYKEIRNGEWEFQEFTADGKPNDKVNLLACLQCHRSQAHKDFLFTFDSIKAVFAK